MGSKFTRSPTSKFGSLIKDNKNDDYDYGAVQTNESPRKCYFKTFENSQSFR